MRDTAPEYFRPKVGFSASPVLQNVTSFSVYSKLSYIKYYLKWSFVDNFKVYIFEMKYEINSDKARAITLSLKKYFN